MLSFQKKWIYLWDSLVCIFVLFPFLTGGIWIERPGLKIELTEITLPVAVLSLLAWVLWKLKLFSITESKLYLAFRQIWRHWTEWAAQETAITLWVTAFFISIIWSIASLRRHFAFGSSAYDLGIFTQTLWNLDHGNGYISSIKGGVNLLTDHQSPILWVFSLLFKIYPHPETLLALQAFGLASGGVALYYLGRQYLKAHHPYLPLLPLLYWSFLPLRNANAYDFHPEVFMLPLLLWGIVGLQGTRMRSLWGGALAFLGVLACKETAGPVLVGVGIAWLGGASPRPLVQRTRWIGFILILIGILAFLVCTLWVPAQFNAHYAYHNLYSRFGEGFGAVLLSPLLQPKLFWSSILNLPRIKFLLGTLAPLAFLPLLNFRTLLASLPGYLILFLTEGDHRVQLIYHYSIEPSIGLFWALPVAVDILGKWAKHSRVRKNAIWVWVLFWALAFSGRSEMFRIRKFYQTPHTRWLSAEFLPCVTSAPTAASDALVPHLSTRSWIQHLPKYEMPEGQTVSCIIRDTAVNNWPMNTVEMNAFPEEMNRLGFKAIYQCDSLEVFQRNTSLEDCLQCQPQCPVP